MLAEIRRQWRLNRLRGQLKVPEFAFLLQPPPDRDWVSIDCETSSLNVREAELLSIGAVRIRGNRIVASDRFYVLVKPQGPVNEASIPIHLLRPADLEHALPPETALRQLLAFIGSRPLVGYYLEYDIAILNKYLKPWLGITLANPQIEISSLYYDRYFSIHSPDIDLRFDTILRRLNLPILPKHDAFNDAVMAAMALLKLKGGKLHQSD